MHEGDLAALLGQDRQRRGHVAADRVAGDRESGGVEAFGRALLGDPQRGGVGLLDGQRVAGLG